MEEHVRATWEFLGMTFYADTLVTTWIVMAFLLIFGYIAGKAASNRVPGGTQNIWEMVIEFVRGLVSENMDYKKGAPLLSYLVTLIMFIFFSNVLGLFPNFTFHAGGILNNANMMSPTADLNTTLALATLTIIISQALGIWYQRGHYFGHFMEPNFVFLPIHLVELLSKPITLSFRLYGNIYAGEVLIGVLLSFFPLGLAYVFGGFIPQVVWLAFSVFVGVIQAFVFTMLTIVYVSQAIGTEQSHH